MSEARFTKAPWESVPDNRTIRVKPTQDQRYMGGTYVCSINLQQYDGKDEANANAHLIAAAPELYSVLAELEESIDYWSEYDVPIGIQDRIKNVLSKARGER